MINLKISVDFGMPVMTFVAKPKCLRKWNACKFQTRMASNVERMI